MKKILALVIMTIITFSQLSAFAMVESAECACVINALTGDVVFSKNMNQKHAMASTTKIMTAIVAIERCNMDEIVDVSATAANQEGSAAYISEGNQYYMKDLLYGLMLNSGNDAAVAIAEHVAGSEESFAELMNEKAEELGLGNTHFMNPSGLDNPEHYTTVYNLALIARYAMTLPQFREIVATQTAQVQALNSDEILYFSNHNKMLSLYEGANGIKTGFTKSTGRCLVSSAQRDGMEFIAVTLNDPNDWNDHAKMLDYAFSEHYPKKLIEQGDTVKVTNIDGKDYSMVAASDFTIPFKEHQKTQVEVISHISNDLQAPINQGEKVGWLEIVCDGVSIGEVDIISENDIYGVSIDHDPEFGSDRSDPYYEWCDITDIDELKKQKEMLWEKIRCIERPYREIGGKYVKVGIIVSVAGFFSMILLDIGAFVTFLSFVALCVGIGIIIKGNHISNTLARAYNNFELRDGLSETNLELYEERNKIYGKIHGIIDQMERVERTQKMMNKSNNRIVNDKISSADIGRAKKELEDMEKVYKN